MGYTGNVLTGGTASASSRLGAMWDAQYAFDSSYWDYWRNGSWPGQWIKYDLGSGVTKCIAQYQVRTYSANTHPIAWTFEGSNDDSAWTTIDTQTGQEFTSNGETKTYNSFTNATGYRYYRWSITESHGTTVVEITTLLGMESDVPPVTVSARATQTYIEALLTGTGQAAAVTGVSAEALLTDTAQTAAVTQIWIEALIRRPSTPVLEVPCLALYWDSGTRYYSDRDARHPDRLYAGRVLSWSPVEREAEPHTLPRCSDLTVRLANADGEISTLLGAESPLRRRATIHIGPEGGSWASEYKQIYDGVVSDCRIVGDGTVEIRLLEKVSDRLADSLSNVIDPDDWPDLPASAPPEYAPVIYGVVTGLQLGCVDESGWRYVVACHPVASVDHVYIDGIEEVQFGGNWTATEVTVGSETWTLLDFASQPGSGLASVITVDVHGVANVGGTAITNPVEIVADYCERFAGLTFRSSDNWATAAARADSRSWTCSLAVVAAATHEETLGRLVRDYGLDLIHTWRGWFRIDLWDSATALQEAGEHPDIDAHTATLVDSSAWALPRQMISDIQYRWGWDAQNETWQGSGVYSDALTLAAMGGAGHGRRATADLRYVNDAATALDIVRRRQYWAGRRANSYTVRVPAGSFLGLVDIGDLVDVSGLWKPQVNGQDAERCRIVAMALDFVARTLELRLVGTGFAAWHVLGDETDPAPDWDGMPDDERWNYWHLADEATGTFPDGEAAHSFADS